MLPPGPHFISYRAVDAQGESSFTTGFFVHLQHQEVCTSAGQFPNDLVLLLDNICSHIDGRGTVACKTVLQATAERVSYILNQVLVRRWDVETETLIALTDEDEVRVSGT